MTENKELFNKALKFILKWEGGYVNNPNDLGGATNKGITQKTYDSWRKGHNLSLQSVRLITDNEVQEIYYNRYWIPAGCAKMTAKFAVVCFDTAINMGVSRVSEFLKAANYLDVDKFLTAREKKYKEFANYGNQRIFLKGWLNRLNALRNFIKTV